MSRGPGPLAPARAWAGLFVALLACTSSAPNAANTGWTPLFNGRDLDGWTPKIVGLEPGVDPERVFRVEDGLLTVSYADATGDFDGRFGHLFHQGHFERYRLRVEYRFVGQQRPGGPGWAERNSGVMIHGQTPASMTRDQDFPVSLEVQLLGGLGQGPRPTANLCTPGTHVERGGRLITQHCTDSTSDTFDGDGWVTVEIEVDGGERICHRVDGEVVLEYARPRLDDQDADARRLLEAGHPALLTGGSLALQSESHPVQFRRVEWRPLDD